MIDWMMLARAKDFYTGLGYRYIDTPWIVPKKIAAMTFCTTRFDVDHGTLVGSGEQGLLWMAHIDEIDAGRWMTITPCWRDEVVYDEWHQPQFMKLELMDLGQFTTAIEMLDHARDCFEMLAPDFAFATEETSEGFDLTCGGIELGSYGEREAWCEGAGHYWTYGTGLALPRFTRVVR